MGKRISSANGNTHRSGDGSSSGPTRVGDLAAMARILVTLTPADDAVQRKRKLVAEFCRLVGEQLGAESPAGGGALPPRVRQTLELILAGDGEKQIALRMGVSRHTVHVYIKSLYRHYEVSSRGELLARFVRRSSSPAPSVG